MSTDEMNPFSLVASLEAGPEGRLRIRYEALVSHREDPALAGFGLDHLLASRLAPMVEIDRDKLRRLQFTQRELAEIGFSMVTQLMALERRRAEVEAA